MNNPVNTHIFQFIPQLAHTCRTQHCAQTCWYSKAQTRDHFWEHHLTQGHGAASGMLRKSQLCLKDSPGLGVKLFLSTPLEESSFPSISKGSRNCKASGTTHGFSSLHLTPKNTIHMRKIELIYAQHESLRSGYWRWEQNTIQTSNNLSCL